MASLGVLGDPDGWLHAGSTMSSVVQRLEGEIGDADGSGGSGLRPHWYGPVADAYQDAWQQRRSRYDDLIGHARPGVSAISDFAARMIDFQRTALNLEQKWLGAGLVLTADGLRFTLPAHHASLPQELKQGIESLLGESERDLAEMWRDIDAAVQDLDTALRSGASALEDFGLLGALEVAFLVSWADTGMVKQIRERVDDAGDGVEKFSDRMDAMAKRYRGDVDELKQLLGDDPHPGIQARLASLERTAGHVTEIGDRYAGVAKYAKYGGWVLMGIGVLATVQETRVSIRKDGVERGIEEHIGDWATIAAAPLIGAAVAGAAVALGLGVVAAGSAVGAAAVVIGVGAVTAVACVGVGWAVQHTADFVQHEVEAHGAAVVHAGETVVDDTAKAVGAGVHDLENLL